MFYLIKPAIYRRINAILEGCFNKDDIVSRLDQMKTEQITKILKVPMILGGFEAIFLSIAQLSLSKSISIAFTK